MNKLIINYNKKIKILIKIYIQNKMNIKEIIIWKIEKLNFLKE